MRRSVLRGIYKIEDGSFEVDSQFRKQRIRKCGFKTASEAEEYLAVQRDFIRKAFTEGERPKISLEQAAIYYLEQKQGMPSMETDAHLLKEVMRHCGSLTIDQIHNDTLKPFIEARRKQGMKNKTINNALSVVRRICVLAASDWRLPNGLNWLDRSPVIKMLPLNDQRPPKPISWHEQKSLLKALPPHLADMALFVLNTGLRSSVVCNLRWEWEAKVPLDGMRVSVFVVPRRYVKGRERERIVVCNSIAQSLIDKQRGRHDEFVFTYYKQVKHDHLKSPSYFPTKSMYNTAWQTARKRAGLGDLHVHDLRHTVGMRLRLSGVSERTQDEILWHSSKSMAQHYASAQIREIFDALELISKEGDQKETLNLLALVRRTQMLAANS